jgi:hypothetical protein
MGVCQELKPKTLYDRATSGERIDRHKAIFPPFGFLDTHGN